MTGGRHIERHRSSNDIAVEQVPDNGAGLVSTLETFLANSLGGWHMGQAKGVAGDDEAEGEECYSLVASRCCTPILTRMYPRAIPTPEHHMATISRTTDNDLSLAANVRI